MSEREQREEMSDRIKEHLVRLLVADPEWKRQASAATRMLDQEDLLWVQPDWASPQTWVASLPDQTFLAMARQAIDQRMMVEDQETVQELFDRLVPSSNHPGE